MKMNKVRGYALALLTCMLLGNVRGADQVVINDPFDSLSPLVKTFGNVTTPQVANIDGNNVGLFYIASDGAPQGIYWDVPAGVGDWSIGVDWLATNPNYDSLNTLMFTATFQSGDEAGLAFQNQGDGNFGLYRMNPGGSVDLLLDQTTFPQGSAWRRAGMAQNGEEISFTFAGNQGTFAHTSTDPLARISVTGVRPVITDSSIPVLVDNLHIQAVSAVPEPRALFLLGFAGIVVLWSLRMRR